jgi:hypothetical protein
MHCLTVTTAKRRQEVLERSARTESRTQLRGSSRIAMPGTHCFFTVSMKLRERSAEEYPASLPIGIINHPAFVIQIIVLFRFGSVGAQGKPGRPGLPVAAKVAQQGAILFPSFCA